MSIEKRRAIVASYDGPKSICECGHLGDGPGAEHGGIIGRGACTAKRCGCGKFIWAACAKMLAAALKAAS